GLLHLRQKLPQELAAGVLPDRRVGGQLAQGVELVEDAPAGERAARVVRDVPAPAGVPGPEDAHPGLVGGLGLARLGQEEAGHVPTTRGTRSSRAAADATASLWPQRSVQKPCTTPTATTATGAARAGRILCMAGHHNERE